MFVTVFLGILNLNDGSLVFCNAGHNPPYLKRDDGKLEHLNQRHGPIIGAVEGIAYKEDRISIKPDDIIFLYTDGVTEAMNEDQTLYSDDRLIDLLESNELESAEHAVGVSVDDVWRFQGDAEQADDVTVMSVAYYGAMAAEGAELEIRIANKLEEIVRANDEFNEFAARHDLPDKLQQKLNLVFDELLNNTITYGFDDDREDHEIGIDVRLTEDMISLVIWDDGKPFNPFEEFAPDTTLSVSERPIGGLGIHLVRNLMDEISYKRHGERNELTLRKKIDKGNDA
jgi:sigma-B regulation protein RsbU (phosphoserine phosphatase)